MYNYKTLKMTTLYVYMYKNHQLSAGRFRSLGVSRYEVRHKNQVHSAENGRSENIILYASYTSAQELCESRGGRPGLPSVIVRTASVDVKQH